MPPLPCVPSQLDDLLSLLVPDLDLDAHALEHRALRRTRKIQGARQLLRLAGLYGPGGLSLRSTAAWLSGNGQVDLSDVAVLKALRRMADWMAALTGAALSRRCQSIPISNRPLVLIDATQIAQPGSTGLDWRLHCRYQPDIGFTGFELTDRYEGEKLSRHAISRGDIVLGDRAYGLGGAGLLHVVEHGADYVIRAGWRSLGLRNQDGEPFDLFPILDTIEQGKHVDLPVQVTAGKQLLPTRLIILKQDEQATTRSLQRVRRKAQRSMVQNDPRTIAAAGYTLIVTSLDEQNYPAADILALYRWRWQIELAFKRLKSLLKIDRLPAKDKELARTWLYSHLLCALAIDLLTQQMLESSPCAGCSNKTATIDMATAANARYRNPIVFS